MFGQEAAWTRLLWNLFGAPDAPTGSEPPPPTPLLAGRYRLEQRLGDGGAGVVFRGYDTVLEVPVAVKVFRPDGLFTPDEARAVQADLRAEARASMRLAHPNIARVHTYESDGPWELLVMEFVDGVDLMRFKARQPEKCLPLDLVLRVGIAVADALAYAHRMGVVHNDVKPANILIARDGTPKLCDFGLSLLDRPAGERRLTGSPSYMPPERIRGERGTPAGDQYAFAATLFSLATGHAPFGGDRAIALRGHLESPMPTDDRLPGTLDRVLRRAMAKQPADRFPGLEPLRDHLRAELAAWIADHTGDAIPTGSDTPPPPPPRVSARPVPTATAPAKVAPKVAPKVDATDGTVGVTARAVRIGDRVVQVAPFRIEVVPVTNAAYRRYVVATRVPPPAHWLGDRFPEGRGDHPVVGVTLGQARAYAAWAGRRLPTEAEWMAVLRGSDDRRFPWGAECDHSRCRCIHDGMPPGTAPVDAHPGSATPEGVLDLLGNVWEWVDPDPRLPGPAAACAVALGGSFRHPCPVGGSPARTELVADKPHPYVGFRCARGEG